LARCCGNTLRCNCLVTAGPGVTVDGDGSTGAPYVISAEAGAVTCDQVRPCLSAGPGATYDPATGVIGAAISADPGNQVTLGGDDGLFVPPGGGTALQVTDTPSVDLTLSGSGAAGDPYDVTAAVRLDAAPPGGGSNLIHEGPDGLYVECGDVRSCLVEGDGIDYDPATGTISARPSAEPGNTLTIGGDGGLMVPPGGGGATALEVTDSPSIDLTLTGTGAAGDPYDVTATVLLSTDADNRAVFGSDGALYVPPADPLSTDCGLTGDGTPGSPLAAAVQPWPYPCDADAEAGGVYCDSAGNLRSEPRGRYQYFTGTLNENFPNLPVPTTGPPGTLVTTRELEITNPDPCRPAIAITSVEVDVDFNIPAGGQAAYFLYNDEMYKFENRGSAAVTDVHTQTVKVLGNTTIPPGGTVTVQALINLGQGAGGATYNRIQHFLRAMVFVL
jgi:hypothetical protein